MKIILIIMLLISTSSFASSQKPESSAKKRLAKWKTQYCDNTAKRKVASDCRVKAFKEPFISR